MNQTPQAPNRFSNWIRNSITARMIMIGFLILILLIPLNYTEDLISDRKYRQQDVVASINQQWGNEVLLYGPMLQVPYTVYTYKTIIKNDKETVEVSEDIEYLYLFPSVLDIEADATPQIKKRGIYETAVYDANIQVKGNFNLQEHSTEVDIDAKDIHWNKASVVLLTSNLKGIHNKLAIDIAGHAQPLKAQYHHRSGYEDNNYTSTDELFTVQTPAFSLTKQVKDTSLAFELNMGVYGSEQIRFTPIGKETTAHITSNWTTANFIGEYLPYNPDKIHKDGFSANWKVLEINRPFAQYFKGSIPNLDSHAFGVNFMIPIDQYLKSERAGKYGFLVIALTFLIFFLIQTRSKINMHPFQYLMIGIALVLFYTLLVAISEYSNFQIAYIIAGIAVITLISLYSISIFHNRQHPTFIALSLGVLYAFIFAIIQMESYALLVGSIGMFMILAAVMYFSRKIEW